tara:strand:+ start:5350 stop:8094 length:2745 start_codon:yes stop_codon:yes gene_type:complete
MLRLQLYIEEQEIELFKDESISLTQSIQDVRDISKVFTDYTKTFSVPASRVNNKVFKHFYNFNIDGYDPRYKKSAQLHLNYKLFKKGKIKLETAELRNNKPHTYKVTFFGDTINLKDSLDEDQLSVLTELNVGNFDYSDANIKTYMANGLDVTIGDEIITDAIVFPLITHTANLGWKDNTTNFADGSYNLSSSVGGSNGVPLTELKPAIKIHALIKAIQLHYPLLTFSTDFFTASNTAYSSVYMWLHSREGTMFGDFTSYPVLFDTGTVSGDIAAMGAPRTNLYPNKASTIFPREMKIIVTPSDIDDEYNLIVKKNGIEFKRYDGLTNVTTNGAAANVNPQVFGIETGDYTFFIESKTANTFVLTVTVRQGSLIAYTKPPKIVFTGQTSAGAVKKVDLVSHLPKIKILEFLTGLFKTFNLTAFQDVDGVINIKTLDSYYSSSTTFWDITENVDKKTNKVDTIIPYKRVKFYYEGTGTFLANQHKELAKQSWGELDYVASSDKRTEGQTYEIKLPFEHMKFQRIRNETTGAFTEIVFGRSVNESQSPYLGKPVLFYVNTSILSLGALSSIAVYTQAGAKETVNQPYFPSNHLNSMCTKGSTTTATSPFGGITFDQQNLHFNAEMSERCFLPNEKTLFKTYYETYVKDLFDDRKRLTTLKAYLPIKITEKITLADKIIVADNAYKINKLTTNFENNLSTLELTNTLDTRSYQTTMINLACDLTADNGKSLNHQDFKNVTIDQTCKAGGFDIFPLNTGLVSPLPANLPKQLTNNPLTVAAPQYNELNINAASSAIVFTWNVEKAGLIDDNQEMIQEHGVFITTTESNFYDTRGQVFDIDSLKTTAGISNYYSTRITKPYTGGTKSTPVDNNKALYVGNLSSSTKYYYKFYIRTISPTLSPQYNVADTQSGLGDITTL